jgi:hypothetical protein
MTPQELERTLDFILQHQAKTAVHLERLAERQSEMQSMLARITELAQVQSQRLDRHGEMEFLVARISELSQLQSQRLDRHDEMEFLVARITELSQLQSERLDRHDEMFRSMRESFDSAQIWQREAHAKLDEILNRLSQNR